MTESLPAMNVFMDHEESRTTCGYNVNAEPCPMATAAHWAMACECGQHADLLRLCAKHDAQIAGTPPTLTCVDCEHPAATDPHQCAVVLTRET